MDYEFFSTEFYQNERGELFAVVSVKDDVKNEKYKFIHGLENLWHSGETLFDEASTGFPGYPVLDLSYRGNYVFDYFGIDIESGYTDIFDLIEESSATRIAFIWCEKQRRLICAI